MTKLLMQLKQYKNDFESNKTKFLDALAQKGYLAAKTNFANAIYDGNNDVNVVMSKVGDTRIISAVGSSVLFIEFGTGVVYQVTHPQASELGMNRGEYGKKQGKNNSWAYYGEGGTNGQFIRTGDKGDVYKTQGNPANMALYKANKEMEQNILNLARRFFSG